MNTGMNLEAAFEIKKRKIDGRNEEIKKKRKEVLNTLLIKKNNCVVV